MKFRSVPHYLGNMQTVFPLFESFAGGKFAHSFSRLVSLVNGVLKMDLPKKVVLTDEEWEVLFPWGVGGYWVWFLKGFFRAALAILPYPLTLIVIFSFEFSDSVISADVQYIARSAAAIMAVTFIATFNFVLSDDFSD